MIITTVAAVTAAPNVKIMRAQSRSSTEDIAMALLSIARSAPIHRGFALSFTQSMGTAAWTEAS